MTCGPSGLQLGGLFFWPDYDTEHIALYVPCVIIRAMTATQELAAVRAAIQGLSTGAAVAKVSAAGQTVEYFANQLDWLARREAQLLKYVSIKRTRKRTFPDFT